MSASRIVGFVICCFLTLVSVVALFQGGAIGAKVVEGLFAAFFALLAFLCARPR
jgi:hypothetical protein